MAEPIELRAVITSTLTAATALRVAQLRVIRRAANECGDLYVFAAIFVVAGDEAPVWRYCPRQMGNAIYVGDAWLAREGKRLTRSLPKGIHRNGLRSWEAKGDKYSGL